jgi:hypothetical protein
VEGPHFSRLSRSDLSSPLVGKKAANVVSDSESNNRNESSHSLLIDDRDIVDCLMNLPCLPSRKKKDRRPTKCRKCFILSSDEQNKPRLSSHIYDSNVEQSYLNLPEDMVEDNPLDLENIKERKYTMKNSCSLWLNTQSGTVTSLSTMLKTSCVTLNQVIIQPTGKSHYLRTS